MDNSLSSPGLGLFHYPMRLLARWLRLPPPRFAVEVTRGLPVPMPDGTRLLADHYAPRGA
jgi:predicted acyl esterase